MSDVYARVWNPFVKQVTPDAFSLRRGPGTVFRVRNWSNGRWDRVRQMGQQSQSWQSWRGSRSERRWLSTLIDTMEQVAQPARRAEPCDDRTLAVLRAQLALPA